LIPETTSHPRPLAQGLSTQGAAASITERPTVVVVGRLWLPAAATPVGDFNTTFVLPSPAAERSAAARSFSGVLPRTESRPRTPFHR